MIAVLLALASAAAPAPLRCGAVERPGIAERGDDGVWRGVAVDLCRQAADKERGGIAFRPYRRIDDLRDAHNDRLAVLSSAELAVVSPAAKLQAGQPVVVSRQVLLVRTDAPFQHASDLAGHRTCFIIASEAEAALNRWARQTGVPIQRVGFQEPVELRDGFDSSYCAAMAVDAADIPGGPQHSRELGPALAELPLFAVRPGGG